MAKGYIVDKAIDDAAFILERIHKRWPSRSCSEDVSKKASQV